MRFLVLFFIVSAALAEQTWAQTDYRCKIERVYSSANDDDRVLDLERETYVGKEFTVERVTGIMAGALKNSFVTKPQVIDRGSADNAFKAVTTTRVDQGRGGGSAIFALVINEYVDENSKPFTFLSGDTVFFGSCANFE